MKTIYDPTCGNLFVYFTDGAVIESEEVSPGIIIDYDKSGGIISFEILDAKDRISKGFDFGTLTLTQAQTQHSDPLD